MIYNFNIQSCRTRALPWYLYGQRNGPEWVLLARCRTEAEVRAVMDWWKK